MRRWSGCEKRKGDVFFRTHCTSLSAVPWKMKNRTMDKMLLKLWTFVLYSSICFFFSQLTNGVAAVVMRRQFFPEEEMLLLKGLMMSDPKQQLVDPSSRSMSKYCTEPCTSLVFEISNNCHNCLVAHPQIHNYVQMAHWQLASDVLIALAYFSIPIELLFFIFKAQVFPYKWIVAQFGAFIVLCGLTHLISLWTIGSTSTLAFATMTFFKVTTAFVSCATAITLSWVIPEVLSVKKREILLGIKEHTQPRYHFEDHSRGVGTYTYTAKLPSADGETMELTHALEDNHNPVPISIPMTDENLQKIFNTQGAMLVPIDSTLTKHSCHRDLGDCFQKDRVVAVRLPYMRTSYFKDNGVEIGSGNNQSAIVSSSYALLVLALQNDPGKRWHGHEIDLVTAVADQVAVALSHATVLEESMHARDQLMSQNRALETARMEAEEAVAARNDFLAIMNHEMRTPMHALIALASILLQTNLTADQKAMVETIGKSSSLLSSLINDILDFSRLESGGLSLDLRAFDLHTLLQEVESSIQPLAINKQLAFTMSIPPELPINAFGDRNCIVQILLNVIGNAIKFTLEGEVKLSVYLGTTTDFQAAAGSAHTKCQPVPNTMLEYRYLHIDVQDTGIGIKPMDMPRLFNKFVQADSSTTRNFGGTGLGLAISKKFVQLMGGRICLESEGLGKGTTCKLYLCIGIYCEPKDIPVTPKRAVSPSTMKNIQVMVVDDNSVNRIVTRRLLDSIGCIPTVIDSGQKCLDILIEKGASAFQIILLDLCMPEMDGFAVAREIVEKWSKFERPIIAALTANSDSKTRERCFEVGMDYVLMKPINLSLLKTEMKKFLEMGKRNKCGGYDSTTQTMTNSADTSNSIEFTLQLPPSLQQPQSQLYSNRDHEPSTPL
ncbi:unnamed protein product [Sphagnum troendelagicum]|uniref:Ethylene receptor n=1 Tax=Sphagnum troendelagicum TaxID=128251 RepID=A0ABP0U3P7_9BRYO